jgi:tRNA acetyltransferase TAN1
MIGGDMEGSNILVTFHVNEKERAKHEAINLLESVGQIVQFIEPTSVEGVYALRIGEQPRRAIAALRSLCKNEPGAFVFTYHWVPIECWVSSDEACMADKVRELAEGINPQDRWKMHLHKRHCDINYESLIIRLTDPINKGTVDLKHPNKILVVEILGDRAGMALVNREEVLDVNEVRKELDTDRWA